VILLGLLVIPFLAGLACLALPSRVWWERVNLLVFGLVAVLAAVVCREVALEGSVTALGGFLRAVNQLPRRCNGGRGSATSCLQKPPTR